MLRYNQVKNKYDLVNSTNQSEVSKMPEEQKRQAEKISAEMNKLTPEAREKVLIFVQGMTAMLDTPKKQPKEAV